jgi:hypothetical protein
MRSGELVESLLAAQICSPKSTPTLSRIVLPAMTGTAQATILAARFY